MESFEKIKNLEQLTFLAVRITDGTEVYFPHWDVTEKIVFNDEYPSHHERTYAINNSVVAFVLDRELFILPNINGVMEVLKENNFQEGYFYVPCSNWEYPVVEHATWKTLWNMQRSC